MNKRYISRSDLAAQNLALSEEVLKLRAVTEKAYGLLWHASCNRLAAQVVVARKMLMDAMSGDDPTKLKDGQKRGIAYALAEFGEPASDNPIERFMMEQHAFAARTSTRPATAPEGEG